MIAVAFALPAESSEFVRLLDKKMRTSRGIVGRRHGKSIGVLHIGVGAQTAKQRLDAFFRERPLPELMISAGFAGALDERLAIGDVLLGENFSDPQITAAVRLANVHRGELATANLMLDSASDRQRFAETSGAIAVDMETEFVAASCRAAGVPMLSLRAITDTPQLPFPAPAHVLFDIETQRTPVARLAVYLLTHPLAIAKLHAFSKRVATARRSLTNALDQVLRAELT